MNNDNIKHTFQVKQNSTISELNKKRIICLIGFLLMAFAGAMTAIYIHIKYNFTLDPVFLGIDFGLSLAIFLFGSLAILFTLYRSYKNLFKDNLLSSLVNSFDSSWLLSKDQSFSLDEVEASNLIRYHRDKANNHYHLSTFFNISGNNIGNSFKISEISITEDIKSDREENSSLKTHFNGIYGEITLEKEFEAPITIRPRKAKTAIGKKIQQLAEKLDQGSPKINVDNPKVTENFNIYCKNADFATNSLNSDILNILLEIDDLADPKRVHFNLKGNKAFFIIDGVIGNFAPPLLRPIDQRFVAKLGENFGLIKNIINFCYKL